MTMHFATSFQEMFFENWTTKENEMKEKTNALRDLKFREVTLLCAFCLVDPLFHA